MSFPATCLRATVLPHSSALTKAALAAGGVLFLAAMARIAIPIPGSPVPVTGQTLGVLLIGTTYGSGLGLATFAMYLLAGIAGAPVFAGASSGVEKITGATGGYLIGMMVATYLLGFLAKRRLDQRFLTSLPSMLFGNLIIFSCGLVWLHHFTGKDWAWTIAAGFTPFIVGEALKIAIAGTSLPILWRFVNHKNR
ncbi:MAG: biotin transporter BioY [Candidatus Planktophila sp.]|nr:biotin transporter BioY [Candidatus Planktophila sp.]